MYVIWWCSLSTATHCLWCLCTCNLCVKQSPRSWMTACLSSEQLVYTILPFLAPVFVCTLKLALTVCVCVCVCSQTSLGVCHVDRLLRAAPDATWTVGSVGFGSELSHVDASLSLLHMIMHTAASPHTASRVLHMKDKQSHTSASGISKGGWAWHPNSAQCVTQPLSRRWDPNRPFTHSRFGSSLVWESYKCVEIRDGTQ